VTGYQTGRIRRGIEKYLNVEDRGVSTICIGRAYDAVNDYKRCEVVIALTWYIQPRHVYEIMGRAAADKSVDRDYERALIPTSSVGKPYDTSGRASAGPVSGRWKGTKPSPPPSTCKCRDVLGSSESCRPSFPARQAECAGAND
jgi:hypothetical protein